MNHHSDQATSDIGKWFMTNDNSPMRVSFYYRWNNLFENYDRITIDDKDYKLILKS